ncbi:MAG TPA: hypothetical protein VN923_06700 [Thermoanaerobaculia bacterium]|nr:hypothetical protein [Thermoanaerobaculia bacterium]
MPELYYAMAARILAENRVVVLCVAFALLGAPLVALSLDRGRLYGLALMSAGWWLLLLLLRFHPQRRSTSSRFEDWFYALLLDVMALGIPGILVLAATKP